MAYKNKKQIRKRLEQEWGNRSATVARKIDDELMADLSNYWRAISDSVPAADQVDDTTWRDLDMDLIFQNINMTQSVVGSEVYYAMLRQTGCDAAELKQREALIELFSKEEDARLDVQMVLRKIGTSQFHGAIQYLHAPMERRPSHPWVYYLLALLPILMIVASMFNPIFFLFMAIAIVVNVVVYYKSFITWRREMVAIRHIAAVLNCSRALGKLDIPGMESELKEIKQLSDSLKPIRFWCSVFEMDLPGDLSVLMDYVRIMFMLNMVSACKIIDHLLDGAPALCELYHRIGHLDACISVAALRADNPALARPEFMDQDGFAAHEMVHPLVKNAVPNDCEWNQNVLITGSNASGKSTFVKAIAINAILAQTIMTCYAADIRMGRARIMSSMAIRDSVLNGESYFVAEIRSLKRIMDAMKDDRFIFCFVDEILRGTNTIERIAASSSVLREMAGKRMYWMAATHDVELTRILSSDCVNWHFSEQITPEGIMFTYLLKMGPAKSRNAIGLLAQMGFDAQIVDRANASVRYFETNGIWPVELQD